jgi:ParB-like chromosome segregation protein Spo0J
MKVIEMPLADVVSPENNIRIHSEKQIDEYIRSLEMFDQIRPIVVDENNVVLCGNGMVMALRKMKKTTVYAYKRTDLSEKEKKKLMIADNKIFSLGIDNIETLDAFLEDLKDDLDIPGFDEDVLQSMVADAEQITEKLSQYGTLDDTEIAQIKENAAKKDVPPPMPRAETHYASPAADDADDKDDDAETSDNARPYVICPKCGEHIWL